MKILIIRFVEDYNVDRQQVDAWQHVEPSCTNKPEGLIFLVPLFVVLQKSSPDKGQRVLALQILSVTSRSRPDLRHSQFVGGYSGEGTPDPFPVTRAARHTERRPKEDAKVTRKPPTTVCWWL